MQDEADEEERRAAEAAEEQGEEEEDEEHEGDEDEDEKEVEGEDGDSEEEDMKEESSTLDPDDEVARIMQRNGSKPHPSSSAPQGALAHHSAHTPHLPDLPTVQADDALSGEESDSGQSDGSLNVLQAAIKQSIRERKAAHEAREARAKARKRRQQAVKMRLRQEELAAEEGEEEEEEEEEQMRGRSGMRGAPRSKETSRVRNMADQDSQDQSIEGVECLWERNYQSKALGGHPGKLGGVRMIMRRLPTRPTTQVPFASATMPAGRGAGKQRQSIDISDSPLPPSSTGVKTQEKRGLGRSLTSPIKLHTQPRPSPHLKYKVTEKDWRFTCTIYYARAFHALRARCGVDGWYATALEGCERWVPEGGKSSSHFYRTRDGRLILKQMVTRWTLTEKEALLDFAPSYLEYMLQAGGPTALAKIFGFYSLKYKNVASGKTMRMDVLVMEHLFHHTPTHTLTRTFDLKGIPTRWNVPGSTPRPEGTTPVLWDGDWLEGRNESTLLLHAHCKPILVDAIARDTAFLARSNIMDYSLVVGVDPTRRELVVGLIGRLPLKCPFFLVAA